MNKTDENIIEGLAEDNTKKKAKTTAIQEVEETALTTLSEETEEQEGVYRHKFKTPFEDSGEVYEEIEFDFDALTGKDMIAIETEMKLKGIFGEMAELSKTYQCHVAARAAGKGKMKTYITVDALERLPMKEFFKITNKVRDFLLATGG